MYGYIRQGRRTALTRETIGGVPFWVLTAGQGRLYVALEPSGQTGLEGWLLAQYGLAAGCCGHTPAVTVHLGPAPERQDAAVYLGPDCAARQQVTYAAPGLGPWPVTEQLLAALTAAEQWEPSEIHVVSVTSRA